MHQCGQGLRDVRERRSIIKQPVAIVSGFIEL